MKNRGKATNTELPNHDHYRKRGAEPIHTPKDERHPEDYKAVRILMLVARYISGLCEFRQVRKVGDARCTSCHPTEQYSCPCPHYLTCCLITAVLAQLNEVQDAIRTGTERSRGMDQITVTIIGMIAAFITASVTAFLAEPVKEAFQYRTRKKTGCERCFTAR